MYTLYLSYLIFFPNIQITLTHSRESFITVKSYLIFFPNIQITLTHGRESFITVKFNFQQVQ